MVIGRAAVTALDVAPLNERPTMLQSDPMPTGEQPAADPTRRLVGGPAADREVRHYTTALLAVITVLLVTVEWVLLRDGGGWDEVTLLYWESTIVLYCASGLLANWRQPHNPFGLLMYLGGRDGLVRRPAVCSYPGIGLIGDLTQTLPIAAAGPSGDGLSLRPAPRSTSRTVVASLYTSRWCCRHPSICSPVAAPSWSPSCRSSPTPSGPSSAWSVVARALQCVVVVLRRRALVGPDRRHRMGPLAWYGPVALMALIAVNTIGGLFGIFPPQVGMLQTAIILGLPVLFLAGLLTGSFGRAGELREFLARVGGDRLQPDDLDLGRGAGVGGSHRTASSTAPVPTGGYFYADGSAAQPAPARALLPVHYGGRVVGAIIHDAGSSSTSDCSTAVARVCALAVDHHRVVAVLRAALLDLEDSAIALRQAQFRLVQASDAERRRIARDLHDGVQQSIIVLGLQVRSLEGRR